MMIQSGVIFFPLFTAYVLAQNTAPPESAAQSFFNLASLILGTAAAILMPILIRYFNNLKSEVAQAKTQIPKEGQIQTIQEDVNGLYDRIDKLIDTLTQTRVERDEARTTLERSTREFVETNEKQRKALEEERGLVSDLSRTADKDHARIAELEDKVVNLLGMNQLADLIIDRMETSFSVKVLPETIRIVSAIYEGRNIDAK